MRATSRRRRRTAVLSLLAGAAAVSASAPAAATTAAATPQAVAPASRGVGPIVVATPFTSTPRVQIFEPDGSYQVLNVNQALGTSIPTSTDSFGDSVVTAYLNGDAYPDIIVGAQTFDAAYVFYGKATGFGPKPDVTLTDPDTGEHTGFGTAMALSLHNASETSTGRPPIELWVGAPATTVNKQPEAGAVHHFTISDTGGITDHAVITQDTAGVAGAAEAHDRFGGVLAGDTTHGRYLADTAVIVGEPHEGIGTADNAGAVQQLIVDPADVVVAGAAISQNSAGVPGAAEANDHFGASLSYRGLAIGVPGEGIGTRGDAGLVQLMKSGPDGLLAPGSAITQDTKGVPGAAEDGDRFGYQVAYGAFDTSTMRCTGHTMVAASAPGETIGKARHTGAITLLDASRTSTSRCNPTTIYQGHGLPGRSESGDALGQSMVTRWADTEDDEGPSDILLIGVPGEDVGSVLNAGAAIRWSTDQVVGFTERTLHKGSNFGLHLSANLPQSRFEATS